MKVTKMTKFVDPDYLLTEQYKDASNLEARMALHDRFSTNKTDWQRWVFDHLLTLGPISQILEVGCGPAKLWLHNQERIPRDWHITLVDFSQGMVDQAKVNLESVAGHFEFKQADVQALPFGDHSFDVVIANHMLYHVPDLAKGLAELGRVLKPKGILLAATNGKDHMRELTELIQRFFPGASNQAIHIEGFNLENGQALLQSYFITAFWEKFASDLSVTEVEPIVAYVLSSNTLSGLVPSGETAATMQNSIQAMRTYLAAELAAKGTIHITKATGLFIATRFKI
jgi:ubiquinone/menaquinone biosynthesis C-methylase UbiE